MRRRIFCVPKHAIKAVRGQRTGQGKRFSVHISQEGLATTIDEEQLQLFHKKIM